MSTQDTFSNSSFCAEIFFGLINETEKKVSNSILHHSSNNLLCEISETFSVKKIGFTSSKFYTRLIILYNASMGKCKKFLKDFLLIRARKQNLFQKFYRLHV